MTASMAQRIKGLLDGAGLYKTRARYGILQVLMEAGVPMSQVQIAETLAGQADRVTIYRTLTSLLDADLVHKAYVDERATFYEMSHHCSDTQCHPHFTCTACGRTQCLFDLKLPPVAERFNGFLIQRQKTRLEGLCPDCAKTHEKHPTP